MVDRKVNTCSQIMHLRQQKGGRRCHEFIPEEIWLEILSRLPIKSLFLSRSVCKLWRNSFFTLFRKIETNPLSVPVCGLWVLSFATYRNSTQKSPCFSYICLKNRQNYINREDFFEDNSIYSSGFKGGLLSDVYFDFSIIQKVFPGTCELQYISFVLRGGLLLLTCIDCASEVYNPATRQIYYLPKSPIVEQYGFCNHTMMEKHGLLIQLPDDHVEQKCRFMVVRFCFKLRILEVYYSRSRMWTTYQLKLDDEFVSTTIFSLHNYAALIENGVVSLYVLTSKGCGMATKFDNTDQMKQYCFPLPEIVMKEYWQARLWECEETLYLSFYLIDGILIWKAGSTQVDTWSWVLVLEISPSRQSCMAVARQHLFGVVCDKSIRVKPFAFHPNLPILYLVVKSSLLAYNMKADTLDTICEIKDFRNRTLNNVLTFKPCFSFMDGNEQ